jgi:cardiolipin synthase
LENVLAGALAAALVGALAWFVTANLATPERRLSRRPATLYSAADGDFRRALGVLLGPSILPGNRVTTLLNGDRIFASMLDAIDAAGDTITFETFIFRDAIAEEFCRRLLAARGRGVRVHVLLDWVGARPAPVDALNALRAAGAEIHSYHPPGWLHLGRLNNRTHRKLLVVDGRVGFTGGVGIGTEWTGAAQDPAHWRDTHYRVEGPVVAQMQAAFMDNWIKATGHVLHGPAYFPPLEPVGDVDAQMFISSPAGGAESMHLMVLLAIAAAQRSILIENSYFVPDDLTIEALIAARRRGVRIRLVVPSHHTDAPWGRWATHGLYQPLLDAGVEIFEYQPTMIHAKVMVVDDHWVSLGSGNFDNRSFRLNDEANLNAFSEALAAEQTAIIEADLARSRRIQPRRWRQRRWERRLWERAALLLRSQL